MESYAIHVLKDNEDFRWFQADQSIPDSAQVLLMGPEKARSMAEELMAATKQNPKLVALVVATENNNKE